MKRENKKRVLLLHTGGTLGMHHLSPVTVRRDSSGLAKDLYDRVPELKTLAEIDVRVLMNKDSSSMSVSDWCEIGDEIKKSYSRYDGFVVIHGTDTLVFTASALSFMFEGLTKPIVLTGSQRPLIEVRSDARRNLINAVDIAARGDVCEVCIFFDDLLLRGNRSKKISIDEFHAFSSPNFKPLAQVGLEIVYSDAVTSRVLQRKGLKPLKKLKYDHRFNAQVLFIKCFPGMSFTAYIDLLNTGAFSGVIIEAFGSGNGVYSTFLKRARAIGVPVVLVSQALQGRVRLGLYEAGLASQRQGAISGGDMTSESAIVKMMKLLGEGVPYSRFKKQFETPRAGELAGEV